MSQAAACYTNMPGDMSQETHFLKCKVQARGTGDKINTPPLPLQKAQQNAKWMTGIIEASLVAQTVRKLPAMLETQVQSLGQEDPLEKGIAIHSNILAWRIPWTEDAG